jgi:hypothetical protein
MKRSRPTWDIIVLTLRLGGLASTVTGFYSAIRRIRHDVVLLFRFIARRKIAIAQVCGSAEAGAFGFADA